MNKEVRRLKPEVIRLFRDVMRTVMKLEINHQQIWRDYTRLKFSENEKLKDPKKIRQLISTAREEMLWVQKILDEKTLRS
jgi:hypothetical protein